MGCDLLRYGLGPATTATLDDIELVHSSQNFLVFNKRYDVLINSDDRKIKVTMEHQIRKLLPDLANPNLGHGFYFVHRLDYATSGLICIPQNKSCRPRFQRLLESQDTEILRCPVERP